MGLPALKMFRDRPFVAFAVAAVLGNLMNQFYTLFALRQVAELGVPRPEAVMTLGQWSELACMAASIRSISRLSSASEVSMFVQQRSANGKIRCRGGCH